MNNAAGKLSITSPHGHGESWIALRLEDVTSGVVCVEVRIEMAAFAEALVGHGHQPCTFTLQGLAHVGKVREVKEERVPYTRRHSIPQAEVLAQKRAALAPFEVEGWRGHDEDLGNHHRGSEAHGYLVHFTRFVEAP